MMRLVSISSVVVTAVFLGCCSRSPAEIASDAGHDAGPPSRPDGGLHFGALKRSPAAQGVAELATGDFDGDGRLDLVASIGDPSANGSAIEVLKGRGDGTFLAPVPLATAQSPRGVATLDVDGDGRLDIAVGVCTYPTSTLSIFLNSDGGFGTREDTPAPGCPYALATADLNGDGHPDLVSATPGPSDNFTARTNGEVDVWTYAAGSFHLDQSLATAAPAMSVVVADFDGDGRLDLAATTISSVGGAVSNLSVWLAQADGRYRALTDLSLPGGLYRSLAAADLDRDGRVDLALVSFDHRSAAILIGLGDGTFRAPSLFAVTGTPVALGLADFRGSGWLDLAVAEAGTFPFVGLSVFPGGGGLDPEHFGAEELPATDGPTSGLAIGDFDGDGLPDIALSQSASGTVVVVPALASAPSLPDPTTFKPALPPTPLQVPFQGGPVIASPELITLSYAEDPFTSSYQRFGEWVVSSEWLATVGAEYGVGLGTHDKLVLAGPAPAQITDSEIQMLLSRLIADGGLASPGTPPHGAPSQLYMLYLPYGTTVIGPLSAVSCVGFGGYHAEDDLGPIKFAYAVVPNCYGTLDSQTIVASHELVEASTDPLISSAPAYTSLGAFNSGLEGEVGDVCTLYDTSYALDGGPRFQVQRIWSDSAAARGLQPCIPAPQETFGGVWVSDAGTFSPGAPNYFQIAPGQSRMVTLTGWTSQPSLPFGVQPIGITTGSFQPNFYPNASVSQGTLANGEELQLTIGVPKGVRSGSIGGFVVVSGFDDTNYGFLPLTVFVP